MEKTRENNLIFLSNLPKLSLPYSWTWEETDFITWSHRYIELVWQPYSMKMPYMQTAWREIFHIYRQNYKIGQTWKYFLSSFLLEIK
jgi:hypothetical protein